MDKNEDGEMLLRRLREKNVQAETFSVGECELSMRQRLLDEDVFHVTSIWK